MASLSLSLLGQFKGNLDARPLAGFRTNKVQALLVYLAAGEPGPHRREDLAALFWPGLPEQSARVNLRQIIYHLRQTIPDVSAAEAAGAETTPFLLSDRQTVGINPEADIEVDIHRFTAFIEQTLAHEHPDLLSCQACRENLAQAAQLYRGQFLADIYLDDSDAFEGWAAGKRQILGRQALDALETLTNMHMSQKAYAKARGYAERQLQLDDLRESAYRQMMKILALSGQRSEALALYETCRRLLARELGMAPTTRTTALYERILAGGVSLEVRPARDVRGYDIKEEIGSGAFGAVHRALQPAVGREVAVKIILAKYANDAAFIRRFEAEAQTIARLEHPFIVPLYDYWREPDGAYLVMRLLRGGSLQSALEEGPWPVEKTAKMVDQVADALNVAHQRGIVHRDIKPANILLDEEGNSYLSDFGIAKYLGSEAQMTATGAVVGTPDYISPEQILNQDLSPQTDVYSLGAVLYETLTGEKPFADSSLAALIHKHLNEPLPHVTDSRSELSPEIDLVIQRATAKKPADRFADALEMAAAFRAVSGGSEPILAGTIPKIIPVVTEVYNPYKGLRAFQEADSADFFGRQVLVDQLLTRLAGDRFLAVVGPSGGGKSSLVKAGLIPALRDGALPGSEKWFVAEMAPGEHPLEELETALLPLAVDPPPSLVEPMLKDERGLLRTVERILPDEPGGQLLLFIDQFEEVYTLVENEKLRRHFVDSLLAALNEPGSPLRLVITLRADFYDRPLRHQGLGELLKRHTELVLPLKPGELEEVVRAPAERVGVVLEPGLLAAITAGVAEQPGSLPLLQYALTELFERRRNHTMTMAAYREIGGVTGALGRRAEELYRFLDDDGQATARQLFLRLVTLGEGVEDTRRRVLQTELEALVGVEDQESKGADDQPFPAREAVALRHPQSQVPDPHSRSGRSATSQIPAVIEAYGRYRLLTFDRDATTREPTVEVAHEALLREWPRLRGWLDESRDDVRAQRRLAAAAAEWQHAGQDPGFLLQGSRLDQFAGWVGATDLALTPDEHTFLETSLEERRSRRAAEEKRRQRELETAQILAETERARAEEQTQAAGRLRQRAVLLAGALVVAVILAVLAISFARQSNQNADLAVTRELEALAQADQRATAQVFAQEQGELALAEADSRATAQAEAEDNAQEAVAQRATAEAEADIRATAEAVAIEERQTAEEQTRLTTSRELALAAINNLDVDPERSILLALEALNVRHTSEAEEALHQAVQASRVRLRLQPYEDYSTVEVEYSPDGTRLLTADTHGTAMLWDLETGEKLVTFDGHVEDWWQAPDTSWVVSPDFSPDGKRVATGGDDGTVRIWDSVNGRELLVLEAHDDRADGVDFSPDGTRLLTASWDNTAKIWNAENGELLLVVEDIHPGDFHGETGAWDATFSPDGSRFATAGIDGLAVIRDTDSGEELLTLAGHDELVQDVAFSPDGLLIATSSWEGTAKIWDATTGEELHNLEGHSSEVWGVAFSPDGSLLGTTSPDGTAKIWDVETGEELLTLAGHSERVHAIAFSPDGSQVATGSRDRTARIWDVGLSRETLTFRAEAIAVTYSPDGRRLATSGGYGIGHVWDAQTGQKLMALEGHTDWSGEIEYSPDGKLLASASDDGTAIIWDAGTGEALTTLAGHDDWVNALAFNPDSTLLATAGQDQKAIIWEVNSGKELLTLDHGYEVWGISFSPDGKSVVTGSYNPGIEGSAGAGVAIMWDTVSGERVLELGGHDQLLKASFFSPDGTQLLTTSWDATARLWDAATGEELFVLAGHSGPIWDAAFSSDGKLVTTGSADGTIKIWDVATGRSLLTLTSDEGSVNGVAFSPDGKRLVSSTGGNVREYVLSLDELTELAHTRLTRTLTEQECRQYLHLDACPTE